MFEIGDKVKVVQTDCITDEVRIDYGVVIDIINHMNPYKVLFDEGYSCGCGASTAQYSEDQLEAI